VIWFFERRGSFVRFESRDVPNTPGVYELAIVEADGVEKVETFEDSESLMRRQLELEEALEHDGWQGPFGRIF
jgi:hypothetical protein